MPRAAILRRFLCLCAIASLLCRVLPCSYALLRLPMCDIIFPHPSRHVQPVAKKMSTGAPMQTPVDPYAKRFSGRSVRAAALAAADTIRDTIRSGGIDDGEAREDDDDDDDAMARVRARPRSSPGGGGAHRPAVMRGGGSNGGGGGAFHLLAAATAVVAPPPTLANGEQRRTTCHRCANGALTY